MTAVLEHKKGLALTVFCLSAVWYTISAASGIVNKLLLRSFAHPLSATMSSLLSAALGAIPIVHYLGKKDGQQDMGLRSNLKKISPVAIGKILALSFQFISYSKVSVSYVHTVKATMPIFSVICAYIWLKETHSLKVYLSLVPVVLGVVVATLTEISFDMLGFGSTLMATFLYALLNILVKKILYETTFHPLQLLCLMSQIGAIFLFPFWVLNDVIPLWNDYSVGQSPLSLHVLFLLLSSGLLDFFQNLLAFYLIHHLTAVSYSVTCTAKRAVVIVASLLVLRNPVTAINVTGMCIALVGVFVYNRAKQLEKHADESRALPFSLSDATLLQNDAESDEEQDINQNTSDILKVNFGLNEDTPKHQR